jgi:hypothetical protein
MFHADTPTASQTDACIYYAPDQCHMKAETALQFILKNITKGHVKFGTGLF